MDKPVKNNENCQTLPVNTNFEEIFLSITHRDILL